MGDTIQQEGSMESSYIFVAHGPGLDFVLQGVVVSSLSPGQTFGESSLLQKCPHSFSVLAARKTGVWAAPSQLFREAILASVVQQVSDIRAFLEKVPLLQGLSPRELDCVADMLESQLLCSPARVASQLFEVCY
eukprot:g27726.t1